MSKVTRMGFAAGAAILMQLLASGCNKDAGSANSGAAPVAQPTPAISKDAGMIKSDIQKEQALDSKK